MTEIGRSAPIAVIGAGTMGAGIAQVAAVAGHPVTVYDTVEGAAERAVATVRDRVARLVAKGRLECDPARLRLRAATELGELAHAECVIEAVVEDLAVKQALFADLELFVAPGCVLARPWPVGGEITEHGVSPLRTLLSRSGVRIRAGAGLDRTVQLPSDALLVRCDGRPATAMAAEWGRPVVVVDRALDDATTAGIAIAVSDGCPEAAVAEATGLLQAAGLTVYVIDDAPGLVVTRTVAMLVNGAVDARHKGVASAADIDTAMRLGTNYPLGPLAWGQSWGPATVLAVLDALHAWYGEDRYRPSAQLRRIAAAGGDLREKS